MNAGIAGTVLQKSRAGMLFLFARQLVVQGANIIGLALIARALGPQEYGWFVSLNMLVILGISLLGPSFANALVIAEKLPKLRQYGVIYTAQMAIAIAACLVFGLSWSVGAFDALDATVVSAAALVVASFLLMPRAAAGQASLERELDFKFVAASDIAQCLTFNIVAVALCHAGWGIAGCAIAFAARFVVANLLLRHRREVKIASLREFKANSRLVKSGFYLQSSTLVSAIKDSLNPIVVGLAVGSASVGLLNWAGMVAAYPSLLLFLLARIYLPLFSRLRGDPAQLRDVVSAIVFWTNVFVACLAIPTLIYIDEITAFFFGTQWSAGVEYFYGFWFANLFVATVTPILALMNALHKQRYVLVISVAWMACTWLLGVPLSIFFGAWGFVAANVITQLTNIWVIRHARSLVPFDLRSVGVVWLVSGLAALPLVALQLHFSVTGWQLIGVLGASAALLLFVNFLTFHDRFVRAKNIVIGGVR